jgi:hypothetical protein
MPGRRPVAESTVVQVLLIDTFTHWFLRGCIRAITFHCSVSRELKQVGDSEFDIDLLISPLEARPVLCDKTDDIYKDRKETKKARRDVCICLQEDFEALDVKKKRFC